MKTLALAPEVLIISLHRFVNTGFYHSKVNSLINFPINGLDLSDFMDTKAGYFQSGWSQNPVYDLTVLIEHDGTNQTKNKYKAVARHMPEDKWFEYDDQLVRELSVGMVRKREALMLFYVKRKSTHSMTAKQHPEVDALQESLREAALERRRCVDKEKEYLKLKSRVNLQAAQKALNKNAFGIRSFVLSHSPSTRDSSFRQSITSKFQFRRLGISTFAGSKNGIMVKRSSTRLLSSKSKWRIVKKSLPKIIQMSRDPALLTRSSSQEDESKVAIVPASSMKMSFADLKNKLRVPFFGFRNKLDQSNIDALDEKHYLIYDTLPDSDHIYISYMWILKFLSLSNPGPMCNDDIACAHGRLKPHMHGCKKVACIPVHKDVVRQVNEFLLEQFGYSSDTDRFRHLM